MKSRAVRSCASYCLPALVINGVSRCQLNTLLTLYICNHSDILSFIIAAFYMAWRREKQSKDAAGTMCFKKVP